jgi:hypothetical protein
MLTISCSSAIYVSLKLVIFIVIALSLAATRMDADWFNSAITCLSKLLAYMAKRLR